MEKFFSIIRKAKPRVYGFLGVVRAARSPGAHASLKGAGATKLWLTVVIKEDLELRDLLFVIKCKLFA